MLFLRDLSDDLAIRCRACGHAGVLDRDALERRFGGSYPVLSIGPHFRCSRCDARDPEVVPAQPADRHSTTAPVPEERLEDSLSALRAMAAAFGARDPLPSAEPWRYPQDDGGIVESKDEPEEPPAWGRRAPAHAIADPGTLPDDEDDDGTVPQRATTVSPMDPTGLEDSPPPAWSHRDGPVFATAWRDADDADDADLVDRWDEDEAGGPAPEGEEERGLPDEPAEDDLPDHEIVSFAIRDPDRRAPAANLDDTMAMLRGMVQTAAGETGSPPAEVRQLRPSVARTADDTVRLAARKPEGKAERPAEETGGKRAAAEPAAAARSGPAVPFSDTLAKLRGLLDLDDEPPRRR